MRVPTYLTLFLCTINFLQGALPDPHLTLGLVEKSPKEDVAIEYYTDETDREPIKSPLRQIWLSRVKNPEEKVLLFQHERSADVLISPDESYLAINDRSGSSYATVRLFKRIKGLHYVEQKERNIEGAAWKEVKKLTHYKTDWFDHMYCTAAGWSENSQLLDLLVEGYGFAPDQFYYYIDGWHAIYNLKTRRIVFDSVIKGQEPYGIIKK